MKKLLIMAICFVILISGSSFSFANDLEDTVEAISDIFTLKWINPHDYPVNIRFLTPDAIAKLCGDKAPETEWKNDKDKITSSTEGGNDPNRDVESFPIRYIVCDDVLYVETGALDNVIYKIQRAKFRRYNNSFYWLYGKEGIKDTKDVDKFFKIKNDEILNPYHDAHFNLSKPGFNTIFGYAIDRKTKLLFYIYPRGLMAWDISEKGQYSERLLGKIQEGWSLTRVPFLSEITALHKVHYKHKLANYYKNIAGGKEEVLTNFRGDSTFTWQKANPYTVAKTIIDAARANKEILKKFQTIYRDNGGIDLKSMEAVGGAGN